MLFGVLCACAVLALAVAPGCADSSQPVKMKVDGGRVDYSQGQLAVLLDSNPSTGYGWTYELDGDVLKASQGTYEVRDTTTDLVGKGGIEIFPFDAKGTGNATLTFTYARSWESTDSDKTLVLDVAVEDGVVKTVAERA